MKTLKYLLPVVFLASCVSNKEVYDDVYTKVLVEKPVDANEDLGYADYINNNKTNNNNIKNTDNRNTNNNDNNNNNNK